MWRYILNNRLKISVIAVCVLTVVFANVYPLVSYGRHNKALQTWTQKDAVIIERYWVNSTGRWGGGSKLKFVAEYYDNATDQSYTVDFVENKWRDKELGDEVKIVVNPDNPHKALALADPRNPVPGMLMFNYIFLGTLVATIFARRRIRREKANK